MDMLRFWFIFHHLFREGIPILFKKNLNAFKYFVGGLIFMVDMFSPP